MKPKLSPNPQTIGSLHGYGHTLAGLCPNCKPVRDVVVPMPELIAAKGADYLVRHAIKKIVCRECGSRLDLHVATPERSSYYYPEPKVSPHSDHYVRPD